MKLIFLLAAVASIAACVSTETAVHSYNGNTVEVALYGDTFAYGNDAQKQAQIDAAQVKATETCGKPAKFLSRRMDHQPQNGISYVSAHHLALFKCG